MTLGVRAVAQLAVMLAVASLPAILDRGAVAEAAALYPFAESAHPYWVPSHAFLLYVRAPAAAISACALFLAPGLFLALAFGIARTIAVWVLAGFMLSLVVVSVLTAAAQSAVSVPLADGPFAAIVLGLSAACLLVLWFAVYRGRPVDRPWAHIHSRTMTAVIVGLPVLVLTALAPKFYWDSFNGDGAHTFEAARLLLRQPLPFFGPAAGEISSFPGFTTMLFLYPASWFIRLFGDIEAAVRIPFVLNLAALFCAIVAVTEQGRGALSRATYWLIALSLVVYAVTMVFSGTYSPYSADIALPATQDTMLLALFLGYVFFFIEGQSWWMTLAIVLTYLTLPSGLILIVLWLVAVTLQRPRPWPLVVRSLIVIAACMLAAMMLARLLPALGAPGPGREHRPVNLLRAFAFLQFTDWHRLLYAIVPAGVIPALGLFAWKRFDSVGRSLALVALGYFGLFFVQGHVSLHYFVPAMILPIVVFWRWAGTVNERYRRVLLGAVTAGAFIAFVLSLPRNARPETTSRRVGFAVEDRTAGYERSDPRSFRRSQLFAELFPRDWDASVPERSFGGSPLIWLYYAHHAPSAARPSNYVLQPLAAPAPAELRLVASDTDAALYLRSDSVWQQHVSLRPATPAGSPIYEVPRGVMLRSVPAGEGQRIFSVVNALGSIGVDTAFILNRLGVKR